MTYGYDDKLALYFGGSPILGTGGGGFGGFGGGGGGGRGAGAGVGRETGRGSAADPDVPQARPLFVPPSTGETPEGGAQFGGRGGMAQGPRPRVLLRWAPEKELLVSGMLAGGAELAGTPAVVDTIVGKGHILFFSNNPMWRMETTGSFMLLFNAALNFDNLSPARETSAPANEDRR